MLVVNLNALQQVNFLNLLHNVLGQLGYTQQTQNIVRVGWAIGDNFTLNNVFAFEHVELTPLGNQFFVSIGTVGWG